ncbi:MAG TPA: hypothetical protein VEB42_00915, partial [Chitinophagaceae bacterium]|nr:hypothetical protein [Chitinophagaceae bacterium]
MMVKALCYDMANLFFPQLCCACDDTLLKGENFICLHCRSDLAYTSFAKERDNPLENIFAGRVDIAWASALFYFGKDTRVQHIVHNIKYKGREDLAHYMGTQMGKIMNEAGMKADVVIPVPLHPRKQKERGYNQSALLSKGLADETNTASVEDALLRGQYTSTQTRKSRIARWENVEQAFHVVQPEAIADKNVLL